MATDQSIDHPGGAAAAPVRRRLSPIPLTGGVIAGLLLTLWLVWDWNWFKPIVAQQAAEALGRPVSIGDLAVDLGRRPIVTLRDVTIGNPPDFPADSRFGHVDALHLRIDPVALLEHAVVLPEISLDHPQGDLRPGPSGRPNWLFPALSAKAEPATTGAAPWQTEIGTLAVSQGEFHIVDPRLKSDFLLKVETLPAASETEPRLKIDAKGTYAGQPITAHFIGGSALSLRDPAKPYPVELTAAHGNTRISLRGTVERPLQLAGADLVLDLQGADMSELEPLIGVPLAPTPPYRVHGKLDYDAPHFRFKDFTGTVGKSDLSGNFAVDPGTDRPKVTADLKSNQVLLADLGGFIGATPGAADAPQQTAQQQEAHARAAASDRLLPEIRFNLPKIRAADFDVRYQGRHIEGIQQGGGAPLDDLKANLRIESGVISLDPLSFGVGQGQILLNLKLDGRQDPLRTKGAIEFRRLDLQRLLRTAMFKGAGAIGGQAQIDTTGNSMAEMLGRGNGDIRLYMSGGDLSALLVDLAGLEFGHAMLSALKLPDRTELRCMISDFGLRNGTLDTRLLLIDTTEANILGKGTVNLADETLNLQISTEPKHVSIGSLPAPIDVTGRLKQPDVKPDVVKLGIRGAAVLALAAVFPPAALLPTIQLGLGQDTNCADTVHEVEREAGEAARAEKRKLQQVQPRQ